MKPENIIIAMRLSATKVLAEGYVYDLLFKAGMNPEEASLFIRDLLKTGKVERNGCAFVLKDNGEESSTEQRAVCNS